MDEDELGDDGTQEDPDSGPINEDQGNPPPSSGGGAACPGAAAGAPNDPCNPLGNGVENKPDDVMTPEPTTPGAFPGGDDDDNPEQDPEDLVVIAAACVAQCNSDYQEFNWVQADLDGCIEGCGDKCLKGCERGYQKFNWTESDRDDCIAGCNGDDNMEEEKENDNVNTNPDEPTYNDQDDDDDDDDDDDFENEDDFTGGNDDEDDDGEPQPWEVCGLKCKEDFLPDSRELFECMSGCDSCVAKCRVDYPAYSSQLYECMRKCGADDDKPIGSDIPPGAIDPAFPVDRCLLDCEQLYDKGSDEFNLCITECKRDECADKCKKDNPDVNSIEYNVCFQDNCQDYQNKVEELERELDGPGPTPVVTPTPVETPSVPFTWIPTCTEQCELDYPEGAERDECIRLCNKPPTCEEKCKLDYPEGAQRDECTRLCRKRPIEEDPDDPPDTQGPTQRPFNQGPKCGDVDFVYEKGWKLVDGFLVPPIGSAFEKIPIKEYCDRLVDFTEAPVARFGCTDKDARNYDKDATNDDGSCKIPGCRDPKADNFNAKANEDSGLFPCTYPSQATDPVTTPVTDPGPVPSTDPLPARTEPITIDPKQNPTFEWDCGTRSCDENRAESDATFALINSHRASKNLKPLRWDDRLYRACLDQARYQCQNRILTHFPAWPGGDSTQVASTPGSRAMDAGYVSGSNVRPDGTFNQVVENGGLGLAEEGAGAYMVNAWVTEEPPNDQHKRNVENTKIEDGAVAVVGCYGTYLGGKIGGSIIE